MIETQAPIRGMIVPLVTPFDEQGRVDLDAIPRLASHMMRAGADHLMCTALTGEGLLLDQREIYDVWQCARDCLGDGVGFIPTILSYRTDEAIRQARFAEQLGARAIMVAPMMPELYAGRSRSDVFRFYEAVCDAIRAPVIVFNYPSLTSVDFTPEFLHQLCEIEGLAAVKESTGDSRRVHAIQRLCGDRLQVICGNPNAALESLALGCEAWITGIMNVAPRSARALMDHVARGDLQAAREVYFENLLPIVDLMQANNNPTGTIKSAMNLLGLRVGVPRSPGSGVEGAELEAIRKHCRKIRSAEAVQ